MHYVLKTLTFLILIFSSIQAIAQATWVLQPSGTTTDLNSIFATNPTTVYTVGNNGVAKTTNNKGITWTTMNLGSSLTHNRIRFDGGLATGTTVGANQEILRTYDAGASWVNAGTGTTTLYDFSFVNSVPGWAAGEIKNGSGFLFNIQNSQTFIAPAAYNKAIRGITLHPGIGVAQTPFGFAVGDGGLILMNNGSSWTAQNSNTTNQLNKVAINYSLSGITVIVVGNNGTILRSGGVSGNWTKMVSGTTANLTDIYFPDDNNVYICGDNGTVIHGNYNAMVWQPEQTNTTANLKGIHGFGLNDIWICGANGTILYRSLVAGVSNEKSAKNITADFYPNPATRYATLKVSGLKGKTGAKVQILNMLGQVLQQYEIRNALPLQVSTESLNAGSYFYKVISLEDQSILTGKFLVD